MSSPWFKFPMRYIQSPYFGNPKYDKVYMWLASEVSKSEHPVVDGNREVFLRPGQIVIGRHRAATSLGLSEKVYRNRIETLEKGHLLDRKEASKGTLITLICPDTYEWQRGIYTRKGAKIFSENGPEKGQQRATTIDTLDQKNKNAGAHARREESGVRADEVGPSSVDRFEASFSKHKDAVLAVWRKEREAVGLVYVRSPRNDRAAVGAAAMIETGDWSIELIERAIKALMASPERQNYTLAGLIENLELWVNGGPNHERPKTGKTAGSPVSKPRLPAGSRLREMAIAQGMDPDAV